MPFGPLFSPSIGLSLLKSALRDAGIESEIHYFTIRFAELVGSHFYNGISGGVRPSSTKLAGEWIFSSALAEANPEEDAQYIEHVLRRKPPVTTVSSRATSRAAIDKIVRARDLASDFVTACADEVLSRDPKIVAITSVFQQQTASLALAKRIKSLRPETFILFGGANLEGVMGAETVRQFPFVDAAVSGEGDLIIKPLVRRILEGEPIEGMPGVRTRAGVEREFANGTLFTNAPTVYQMDDLPYPDYDDYFAQFRRSRFQRHWQPRMFFETSRGCWWGEKMHCTFCGLNGTTMQFRSKSAARALDELTKLTDRHPGCEVEMTDNILDLEYFKDFIPELARRKTELGIFYETKANLRKEQIRMMRNAGIRSVQPGIESLHDSVLKQMRKGVSALQNIQLLKWCKELGVTPLWNILVGFPDESPAAYAQMTQLVPLLSHLQPPGTVSLIRLDRFSPNFSEGDKLGIAKIEPFEAYRYVFPGVGREALHNLAYHFEFEHERPQDIAAYARPLAFAVRDWKAASQSSALLSIDAGDHLLIWDMRPIASRSLTVLQGADRLLFKACDAIADIRQLAATLSALGVSRTHDEIESMLAPLVDSGLIVRDGGRYLALAVPVGEYLPDRAVVERFSHVLREIGVPTANGVAVSLNGKRKRANARRFPRIKQLSGSTPQFKVEGSYLLIR